MNNTNLQGQQVPVQIKILDPILEEREWLPTYATPLAAGMDLRACIQADYVLAPQASTLLPSGVAVFIRNPAYAGLILPRSGLGHKHGIILGNGVGLLDADYQGELLISCWNRSNVAFTITPYMKLAQLVIVPVVQASWQRVSEFSQETSRAAGGFGHTGSH